MSFLCASHPPDVTKHVTSGGCDVTLDANWDPHVFAGMEAGSSRSMPGTRIREDAKKGGQKAAKKRNKVEEEEEQEEVKVAERKKEQNRQLRWRLADSMLTQHSLLWISQDLLP